MRFAVGTLLLLVLLAGCAQAPDAGSPEEPDQTAPPVASGVELVNLWRVSGAEGESDETWLRLDANEFQLWRDCGMVSGSWRTNGGLFLASVYGASGKCAAGNTVPSVEWISAASEYQPSAEGFKLTDADGAVVATLTIDGAPDPIPTAAEFYTEPPEVTDDVRRMFEPAAPLPSALEPADRNDLLGRWYSEQASRDSFVEFAEREWSGSDGCNGGGGVWTVDAAGGFLTTSGPSTLIACDGAPIPSWVATAFSAGIDGEQLVLFDKSGAELGRLTR